LFILGIFFSACYFAGIYKCTDANGKTNYQTKSCDDEHKTIEINIKTGSSNELDEQKQQELSEQKEQEEQLEQELMSKKINQLKQEATSESAKNQFLIRNNPENFSAFSIPPYDFDDLPALVKNFQNKLPEIERFRRQAAEKALSTNQCKRVEASELSIKSTKKTFIFSVDCSSGKNFQYTGQELTK
jgi:hypothetical protein